MHTDTSMGYVLAIFMTQFTQKERSKNEKTTIR
jgi:hypothetical protein